MSDTRNAKPSSQYSVGSSAEAPTTGTRKRVAIFIAHGMGQQIPFQSIDVIAAGMRKQDMRAGNPTPKSVSRAVKAGEQWLNRVELVLNSARTPVEAHVYEAYWAPLTEGKVTIRDVIRFLAGAGRNGVRNARRAEFKRWLFDEHEGYPIPIRTLFYLIVALAAVAALVVMNSTIAAVAAGRALLGERASWLTDVLFADLTTTFNAVVTALVAAGAAIAVGVLIRKAGRWIRFVWGLVSAMLFTVAVFAVILAGIALPLLFYGHLKVGTEPAVRLWPKVVSERLVLAFDATFASWAWLLTLIVVGGLVLLWLGKVTLGFLKDIADRGGRAHTLFISGVFAVLVIAAVTLVRGFLGAYGNLPSSGPVQAIQSGAGWALLVLLSAYIRQVLVQFVGDVAVYVMPYKLDAFADLRTEIRGTVYKVANAIYGMKTEGKRLYDQVIVVGHSLGSVISYDVLNQLIREDEAVNNAQQVVGRTPLFLTFGSPLDKTAFIFALQGRNTSEARDALAASVQPMIRSYRHRPQRWVNVYSVWDIVSGHLGFYDLKSQSEHSQAVKNVHDPDAMTLLVAHTEYWENDLVYRIIYDAVAPAATAPAYSPVSGAPAPATGGH